MLARFAEISKEPSLADEIPAIVRVATVVVDAPKLSLTIRAIHVHTTCCLIDLDWTARRTTESAETWKGLHRTVFLNLVDPWPGWEAFGRPIITLTYADARHVRSDAGRWVQRAQATPSIEVPILKCCGGESASGEADEAFEATTRLYLSPLPPPGDLAFTIDWPAFGVPETIAVLDGTAIGQAVQPL